MVYVAPVIFSRIAGLVRVSAVLFGLTVSSSSYGDAVPVPSALSYQWNQADCGQIGNTIPCSSFSSSGQFLLDAAAVARGNVSGNGILGFTGSVSSATKSYDFNLSNLAEPSTTSDVTLQLSHTRKVIDNVVADHAGRIHFEQSQGSLSVDKDRMVLTVVPPGSFPPNITSYVGTWSAPAIGCDPCVATANNAQIELVSGIPTAARDPTSGHPSPTKTLTIGGIPVDLSGTLSNWTVDGVDQLFSQSFFLRTGGGSVTPWKPANQPLDASAFQFGSSARVLSEQKDALSGLDVQLTYDLTGAQGGIVRSQIGETIVLKNMGKFAEIGSFFVFTDFDLGGAGFNDKIRASLDSNKFLSSITQTNDAAGIRAVIEPIDLGCAFCQDLYFEIGPWESFAGLLAPDLFGPFDRDLECYVGLLSTCAKTDLSGNADYAFALQYKYFLLPGEEYKIVLRAQAKEVSEASSLSLFLVAFFSWISILGRPRRLWQR